MTRATERVESAPSSWAATPETCGAAMLVPLKIAVLVLLEPTYAARIPEPGACAHGGGGMGGGSIFGGAEDTGERVASGMPLWREDTCTRVWERGPEAKRYPNRRREGGTCTWTQAP